MDNQTEYVLKTYGERLKADLEGTDFAFAFFPNAEDYADEIDTKTKLTNEGDISISFFQDFTYNDDKILTDYNVCKVDGRKFVKIVTPFLLERSYDFIVAIKSEFKDVISSLRRKEALREKNDKIKLPIIGMDFAPLKRMTIDFLLDEKLREFCRSKFIKLKRGIVLEGPPGCGKSFFLTWLKVQAKINGIEFYSFDNPKDFIDNRERYYDGKKTIFAFEDFDAFVREREDTDNSPNSLLSQILNTLDGIDEIEDVVSVFTTNRVKTFDSAFIRPGRIDKVVTFPSPTDENIFSFFKAYIPEFGEKEHSVIYEYLKEHSKHTSYAILKGICDEVNISVFNNDGKLLPIEALIKITESVVTGANKNEKQKAASCHVL